MMMSFIITVALFSPQITAEPEREARPTRGRFESILWIWDSNPARQTEASRSAPGYTEDQPGPHKEVCIISTYIHVYIYTQCKRQKSYRTCIFPALYVLLKSLFIYRCKHLEKALAEATNRIQELEATNSSLEKKLVTFLYIFTITRCLYLPSSICELCVNVSDECVSPFSSGKSHFANYRCPKIHSLFVSQ